MEIQTFSNGKKNNKNKIPITDDFSPGNSSQCGGEETSCLLGRVIAVHPLQDASWQCYLQLLNEGEDLLFVQET